MFNRVDVNSYAAAEIGYVITCGKTILGYRGDFPLSADNEGSTVNPQVEYFIRKSGGQIKSKISELESLLDRASLNHEAKPPFAHQNYPA